MQAFLAAEKEATGKMIWVAKAHPDYRQAILRVSVNDQPEIDARLVMLASVTKIPRKYDFVLLLGSTCVLRLDVNPGLTHFDPVTLTSIEGTHWQPWPCSSATGDERDFNHLEWLKEFLAKAAISWDSPYNAPPYEGGEQSGLGTL